MLLPFNVKRNISTTWSTFRLIVYNTQKYIKKTAHLITPTLPHAFLCAWPEIAGCVIDRVLSQYLYEKHPWWWNSLQIKKACNTFGNLVRFPWFKYEISISTKLELLNTWVLIAVSMYACMSVRTKTNIDVWIGWSIFPQQILHRS